MKELFKIKLTKSKSLKNGFYYVEITPDDADYFDDVKKCETIEASLVNDAIYLESARVQVFNLLEEMFGSEFTDKYEL
jgi:hypothetical protein